MHFEVRKRVHSKLKIIIRNNMKVLYVVIYQEREKLVYS